MKKDFTVTIGIPAYNEEANIGFLLRDILAQRCRRFVLQEIIVLSDGSTDKTVEIAHSVHSGRIHVFDDGERKGKSERVNEIFDRASESTDAIILLDADIVFSGELALDEMVQAFSMGADLVSPRLTTVPPKTFVGSCIVASHNMKQRLFAEWRNGDNIYSCHGAARLFSRRLFSKLRFPESVGEDAYSYLFTKQHRLQYRALSHAAVSIRVPESLVDHAKQSRRFSLSKQCFITQFSSQFVEAEYRYPRWLFLKHVLLSMGIQPIAFIGYIVLMLRLSLPSKYIALQDTWSVASSKQVR